MRIKSILCKSACIISTLMFGSLPFFTYSQNFSGIEGEKLPTRSVYCSTCNSQPQAKIYATEYVSLNNVAANTYIEVSYKNNLFGDQCRRYYFSGSEVSLSGGCD